MANKRLLHMENVDPATLEPTQMTFTRNADPIGGTSMTYKTSLSALSTYYSGEKEAIVVETLADFITMLETDDVYTIIPRLPDNTWAIDSSGTTVTIKSHKKIIIEDNLYVESSAIADNLLFDFTTTTSDTTIDFIGRVDLVTKQYSDGSSLTGGRIITINNSTYESYIRFSSLVHEKDPIADADSLFRKMISTFNSIGVTPYNTGVIGKVLYQNSMIDYHGVHANAVNWLDGNQFAKGGHYFSLATKLGEYGLPVYGYNSLELNIDYNPVPAFNLDKGEISFTHDGTKDAYIKTKTQSSDSSKSDMIIGTNTDAIKILDNGDVVILNDLNVYGATTFEGAVINSSDIYRYSNSNIMDMQDFYPMNDQYAVWSTHIPNLQPHSRFDRLSFVTNNMSGTPLMGLAFYAYEEGGVGTLCQFLDGKNNLSATTTSNEENLVTLSFDEIYLETFTDVYLCIMQESADGTVHLPTVNMNRANVRNASNYFLNDGTVLGTSGTNGTTNLWTPFIHKGGAGDNTIGGSNVMPVFELWHS